MRAFSRYTRRRLERTHGGVLNLHTEGFSAFSVFLDFCLSFLFSLFSPSLSLLSSLLTSLSSFSLLSLSLVFSLSTDDNDHSSSRLSLCTHGSDLRECRSACALAHSLSGEHVRFMEETNMFASCKKQLSWLYYASLAPLGMKWACICAGNG